MKIAIKIESKGKKTSKINKQLGLHKQIRHLQPITIKCIRQYDSSKQVNREQK